MEPLQYIVSLYITLYKLSYDIYNMTLKDSSMLLRQDKCKLGDYYQLY